MEEEEVLEAALEDSLITLPCRQKRLGSREGDRTTTVIIAAATTATATTATVTIEATIIIVLPNDLPIETDDQSLRRQKRYLLK